MKTEGYIYSIKCIENGKLYIGKTSISVDRRFQEHINDSNSKSQTIFHRAIRKYGKECFEISILENCSDLELDKMEVFWISKLNTTHPNGYNMTSGGSGGSTSIATNTRANASSCFKGVCWDKGRGVWRVNLKHKGKYVVSKRFRSESDAALVYDMFSYKLFGEICYLNFPQNIMTDSDYQDLLERNKRKKQKKTPKFKYHGVCLANNKNRYQAIFFNKPDKKYLGSFDAPEEAAMAWDAYVVKMGYDMELNFE